MLLFQRNSTDGIEAKTSIEKKRLPILMFLNISIYLLNSFSRYKLHKNKTYVQNNENRSTDLKKRGC